jgi:hypothetical protein
MSFYLKVKDQVTDLKEQLNYQNDGTAFGHFILKECFNKIIDFEYDGSDVDSFIKDHIVDMCNDLGNDAILTNHENREINVFQFKYSNTQLLNTKEVKKNKKFIDWMLKVNDDTLNPHHKLKKILNDEISHILTNQNLRENNYSIILYRQLF